MTAMSTLPGRTKECEQDRTGDRLTNVVDRCDNQSEEREEKGEMGVRFEGATDSRSGTSPHAHIAINELAEVTRWLAYTATIPPMVYRHAFIFHHSHHRPIL